MNRMLTTGCALLFLLWGAGCAVIFGGVMAGVQISDAQRVRQLQVTENIRHRLPEPWVVEVIESAQKDYKGQALVASEIAATLTSPTGQQFVAIFVGDSKSQRKSYRGYIVRGELYKGRWILERMWDSERKIPQHLNPIDDYILWVFSKINYFDSRLGTNINPNFWSNSKPLFVPITAKSAPARYREFIGEHVFIAEAVLHMQATRTQSLTIKRQAMPDRSTDINRPLATPATTTSLSPVAVTNTQTAPQLPQQLVSEDD